MRESAGDWRSNLALDGDYPVAWSCGTATGMTFEMVPATMIIHHADAPRLASVAATSAVSGLAQPAIDRIARGSRAKGSA